MERIAKEDLYIKREMKTRRKPNTTFTCTTCEEIVGIKTHTHFYLVEEGLTATTNDSGRFCSTDCVFKHLDSLNVDIDRIIKEHNAMMDQIEEFEKKQ
ncbi:hypothetical protein K7T73_12835 [Bacillus badius]|uniref:hypothetical protein n=1 Tax=Bacillus badius TaxID=1455 RepID=UPI001CC0A7F5|nr:hypothetical protein [Bacillus badius]UAT29485.1 hypothetical protein K7T73_12835 [Bacillus badius]